MHDEPIDHDRVSEDQLAAAGAYDPPAVDLTEWQAEEVMGLLSVCEDDDDLEPWGVLTGRRLVVTDVADALQDLRDRAEYMVDEGPGWTGQALAGQAARRSLLLVVSKIAEAASC